METLEEIIEKRRLAIQKIMVSTKSFEELTNTVSEVSPLFIE